MIAGTPTSAGSIVDLDEQTGLFLVNMDKAEKVVETCPAPTASSESIVEQESTDSDKVDFSQMTKSQIETYGRKLGIELDRRQNKTDLITQLEEFISKV